MDIDMLGILIVWQLRKIVPGPEFLPYISSSMCTNSTTLSCVIWTFEPTKLLQWLQKVPPKIKEILLARGNM